MTAAKKTATPAKKAPAKKATASTTSAQAFTAEEKAAIKERAAEVKAAAKGAAKADVEREVLDKIAQMDEPDRSLAGRVHEVIMAAAPELAPRTWYGMPAYAKGSKVIVFFQNASKFKARYSTLGFNDSANLDDGELWPTSFALTTMTPAVEKRIGELVKRAVS